MPKITWSTPIEHSSDATFRVWGSDLSSKFAAAGLVQTADTGQINWATVTRPGAIAFAGYEIWRFADALQAAAPVFVKVEYGTSNNAATPALRLSVGTATNGAGTLTGLVTSQLLSYAATTLASTTTNYPSYITHSPGFFGLAFKLGAASGGTLSLMGFTVQRSVNNSGTPTATAVMLITGGGSNQETSPSLVSMINYATSQVTNTMDGNDLGIIPMRLTSSLVGLDPQIFLTWMALPKMTPNIGTCVYIKAEVPNGTEFDLALVGTTPRHYIAVGNAVRSLCFHGAGIVRGAAMLWED